MLLISSVHYTGSIHLKHVAYTSKLSLCLAMHRISRRCPLNLLSAGRVCLTRVMRRENSEHRGGWRANMCVCVCVCVCERLTTKQRSHMSSSFSTCVRTLESRVSPNQITSGRSRPSQSLSSHLPRHRTESVTEHKGPPFSSPLLT